MSLERYFTSVSNMSDLQKRFFNDVTKDKLPSWSKNNSDEIYSQDSNNSSLSSCSSGSDSLDLKPWLKSRDYQSDANYIIQTPKKSTKATVDDSKNRITPRKPLKPSRSENKSDPSFRGVTLEMKTNIKHNHNDMETQLVIRSYFTERKKRSPYSKSQPPRGSLPERRSRLQPTSLEMRFKQTSHYVLAKDRKISSDKENFGNLGCRPMNVLKIEKRCKSCGVLRTPLWRDAADGIPLCNACGIRYKKYRVHCQSCWYIPKKEEKFSSCAFCGSDYQEAPRSAPLAKRN